VGEIIEAVVGVGARHGVCGVVLGRCGGQQ
jgi:hypothetical protein